MIDLERAGQFLRVRHDGILATIKRDGRPQLSNILYFVDDDGRVRISVTQTRAKTHNLRRDPRASLHVQGRDRYEYLVAEGTAELLEGEGLKEALRHYYRKVRGEHPNWAEYDAAMVSEQRLLLSISVDRAYGQLR
ncbi:MAG: PPOX class F420-dependent oxidoreductase [Chloroflexota bacterium]|nr:MAG: PPOX class F420-dependent oxidoreductase [Chloroflexota bacterium]TMD87470.1 MAG: PPOX class F420-dependent oxidoreductase [Chloroflexota bacterium]